MQVFYFSRTRKPALENEQLHFLPLEDLLSHCDVVSIHVPKHTIVLKEKDFHIKKKNSVLINTSLGLTFEKEAFLDWLATDKSSFAILDADGAGENYRLFSSIENIILYNSSAGFTQEARERLGEKVIHNLVGHLSKK
jgi:lactate dehydrogenase-like 2-hydroxyacid dehydrogenase